MTSNTDTPANVALAATEAVAAGFKVVAIGRAEAPTHEADCLKRDPDTVTNEALTKIIAGRSAKTFGFRVELGGRGSRPTVRHTFLIPFALEWEGGAAQDEGWVKAFLAEIAENDAADLWERLDAGVVHATPSGGRRWFFQIEIEDLAEVASIRDAAAVSMSGDDKPVVMAELLTQNAIAAPSGPEVHPARKPYEVVRGSLATDMPMVTLDELDLLTAVLELLSDPRARRAEAAVLQHGTPFTANALRACVATPEETLEVLLAHDYQVLTGALPQHVDLIKPGSTSRKRHYRLGGDTRKKGELSVYTTGDAKLPQGRLSYAEVVGALEFGGDALKTVSKLMELEKVPVLPLQSTERPLVNISDSVNTTQIAGELLKAVTYAKSSHDDGQRLVLRWVTGSKNHKVIVPRNGGMPEVIDSQAVAPLILRCAQPVAGFREMADGTKRPVMAHSTPRDVSAMVFGELQQSDALATVRVISPIPVLTRGGRSISAPGYHPGAETYISMPYHQQDFWGGYEVPERPTREDAQAAADFILDEVLADFAFAHDGHRMLALSLMITGVVRNLIDKSIIYMVTAGERGSGKSLLGELARFIATGSEALTEISPFKMDDKETEKRAVTAVLAGSQFIGADNVPNRTDVSSVAVTTWATSPDGATELRALGGHDMVNLTGLTFMFSGNNIGVNGDLNRRTAEIRLDFEGGVATDRKGFRHPDIKQYVASNRPKIVAAIHTIVSHGLQNPIPHDEIPFRVASFDQWTDIVAGSLAHIIYKGENAAELMNTGRDHFLEDNDDSFEHVNVLVYLAERMRSELSASQIADLLFPANGQPIPTDWPEDVRSVVFKGSGAAARGKNMASVLRRLLDAKMRDGGRVYCLRQTRHGGNTKKSPTYRVEVWGDPNAVHSEMQQNAPAPSPLQVPAAPVGQYGAPVAAQGSSFPW